MKKAGIILITTAFVCSSGFLKKDKDGNYGVDTSGIEKQANDAAAAASAEVDKAAKSAEEMQAKAVEKIKAEAAKINVSKDEIMADLAKPMDDIKTKVAAMDPEKLTAYLNQYGAVFADTQTKVTEYTQQVKDLKFTEKFSAKGKELKAQLSQYTDQFNGLKEQAEVYMSSLQGLGFDPAMLGIDLSPYGL